MNKTLVKCNKCGQLIDQAVDTPLNQRKPCPSCGSTARRIEMELEAKLSFHTKLRIKARHGQPGQVRPFLTLQTGDDLFVDTGEWNQREKVEDRDNDRYFELIINPKTGEVIHVCEEPLSKHQGHGSDKTKSPKNESN